MDAPADPPREGDIDQWRAFALEYLAAQLKDAAPKTVRSPVVFSNAPLEGDGPVVIFSFIMNRGGRGDEPHYVVVGQTESNYYPAYGLDADEAYSLHLGTRFMLVMGVAQAAQPAGDYDAFCDARAIADRVAPGTALEAVSVAATFDVDGQFHAVLSCRLAGERIYIMGRDSPTGFSRRVDLLPQVVYRLHIGHVLRSEANPDLDRRNAR